MKQRLGIMGCGQLSQMMAEAARRRGAEVSFLCVDETPVVHGLGRVYHEREFDEFLAACDVITVERESLPDAMLQAARDQVGLAPCYDALVVLRERDTQKAMLDKLEIPTSPWVLVSSDAELANALASLPGEMVRCKRTLGGYDGGGQWRVPVAASAGVIPDDAYPVIAEAEIAIERELAIVVARDVEGNTVVYPVTENYMRDGILIGSIVPASIDEATADDAAAMACKLVNAMNYVGVLAIEFFVTEGRLIVNEIAPRVHNTGHWTIGAVGPDQFTQHTTCVLGGHVEQPVFEQSAALINLLDKPLPREMPEGPIRSLIQTYGKGFRKGRKLGHITLIGPDPDVLRRDAEAMIEELHGPL
ncbi:MAG: ATP-grasp domain-containing protein [Proteobacteria bacterium]|nr:ATP-grasp domain-containing protein [Pseudomonadota bacterium]